jgi:hypothetical protein
MGTTRIHTILVGKSEGKRFLGRCRPRWDDNIKGDRVERYGLYPSGSGWGQVAGFCGHGNEPTGSINDGKFRE